MDKLNLGPPAAGIQDASMIVSNEDAPSKTAKKKEKKKRSGTQRHQNAVCWYECVQMLLFHRKSQSCLKGRGANYKKHKGLRKPRGRACRSPEAMQMQNRIRKALQAVSHCQGDQKRRLEFVCSMMTRRKWRRDPRMPSYSVPRLRNKYVVELYSNPLFYRV